MPRKVTKTGEQIWVPPKEFEAKHSIRGVAERLRHMHSLGIAQSREYPIIL
jgi:hypothetical protein